MKAVKQKERKTRSFGRRLGMRILLVLFIVNVFIIGAVLLVVTLGPAAQNHIYYDNVLTFTGDKLESILDDVEVTTQNVVTEVEENIDQPEQIYTFLEQELKLAPYLRGCFVAFEPNYYPRQGRWFELYVLKKDSALMEHKQMRGSKYDYFQQEWYQKGLKAEKGYWSDPHDDQDGTGTMLCTYVMPVHDQQGRAVGVIGADFPLEWLTKMLREMDVKENARNLASSYQEGDRGEDFAAEVEDETADVEEAVEKRGHVENDSLRVYDVYSFIIGRSGQYIVSPYNKKQFKSDSYQTDVMATPDTLDDHICHQMMAGERGRKLLEIDNVSTLVYYAPLSRAGWSMAIAVPRFTLFLWGIVIGVVYVLFMLIGMVVVFIVSQMAIHRATKPLRFLNDSAEEVAKGNFETVLPQFKYHDEISQLRDSFETMQLSLKKYVEELKQTMTLTASMESELRIAHNIQMSMLPKTFPAFPDRTDIDLYGSVTPAKAVGGDLYDFYIRDEKLFFCIGDVSGKGVPASLVMAVTRSLFRNISTHTAKPSRIVTALNESLSEGNDANMFVTLFVGVLDLPTGRLHYCNAGHDAPWMIPAPGTGNCVELAVESNLPLGVMPGWTFQEQVTMMPRGTTIFLYTDGLNEAENATHQQFGVERIQAVLEAPNPSGTPSTPQAFINIMTDAVHQFVGDTEQSDDLTMLAVLYQPEKLEEKLQRSLTLSNNVQEVPQLAMFVDEVCEALDFDMPTTMQINLAIEEAVVNVMNYAYPPDTQGEVRITAVANDERLKFVISDDGIPFDPTAKEEADITLSAEERKIGGLGIHLVRQIMDSINYERVGNQNVFTLRKKLQQS